MPSSKKIAVYLEIGKKRTFAGAVDWPAWCRSSRDEASALQALLDYAPRYARVLKTTKLGFQPPADLAAFAVVERLTGDATTDFGAPGAAPSSDKKPVTRADLARFQAVLEACWKAFDKAVSAAKGKELRKGPRGGGREVEEMVEHVLGADAAYVRAVGWKLDAEPSGDSRRELSRTRQGILDALALSAQGKIPAKGPRGGVRWTPRYFVRRVAWHVLDHAWEIEDRLG